MIKHLQTKREFLYTTDGKEYKIIISYFDLGETCKHHITVMELIGFYKYKLRLSGDKALEIYKKFLSENPPFKRETL